jgi:CheY-like chemotaxis protein
MSVILIVEDHDDTRNALRLLFNRWGYDTLSAETGEAGLALLSHHHPDLVVVDGMMPGMNGIEFIRLLRSTDGKATIPVVFYTAVNDPDFVDNALQKGANEVWIKGQVEANQMRDRLAAHLKQEGENGRRAPGP